MTRRLAGRYLLGAQLGVGGTSRVYTAVDERLGRTVAVKCLDASLAVTADPAGRERFLREARSAASFSHRHAVTVFDAGEENGELFIVLELVSGPSLAAKLAQSGRLAVEDAVRIAGQVGSALAAAHAIGMVHRDVKPANILLDEFGDAKLADFGLARRFDDLEASVTAIGMVAGSPKYLAPEQTLGDPVTPAADVYALGVVMFEMLAGRVPFDAGSFTAMAELRRVSEAPDVRTLRPDTPAALAGVIARALQRVPADRQPNAQVFVAELDAATIRGSLDPTVMTAVPPVERTQVQPLPSPVHAQRSPRRWGPVVGALVALGFLAAVLVLGAAMDGDADGAATDGVGSDSAMVDSTVGPTTVPPVEPTVPPSTDGPATTPAPETTVLVVPEVIPGFPVTDDLAVFLAQVEQNPELVGPAGPELVRKLEEVLIERSRRKRDDAAEELRTWAEEKTEKDELDPAIAALLDDLLEDGSDERDD